MIPRLQPGWVQLIVLLGSLGVIMAFGLSATGPQPLISRWSVAGGPGLVGAAQPLVGAAEAVAPPAAPTGDRLEAFNAGSALQESVAEGRVRLFRRATPGGGELAYVVVRLDERTHIELINADGAIPGSDASGDTIWLDGGRHRQTVVTMVNAPYAQREGLDLLAAMAFGFHGEERTANEGSVVINGVVHRVNAGRAAICIRPDRSAAIGLFDAAALAGCAQAVGAGPVILWQGRIASTAVQAPTDDRLPFNPLGEDFVQIEWRRTVYNGPHPKTAIGLGNAPDGSTFLVLMNSTGVAGEDLARALRDMGCQDALGGDDNSSTQLTWRGVQLWPGNVRQVPDAVGVYVRIQN
jgi:hypothetical protein